MSRTRRTAIVLSLLLGQALLAGQVTAIGSCHGLAGDDAPLARASHAHPDNGMLPAHGAHPLHGGDTAPGSAACGHCAGCIQCAQLPTLLGDAGLAPAVVSQRRPRRLAVAPTSLAYRREPFRPPIQRT